MNQAIPAVTFAPLDGYFQGHTHKTRIPETKHIRALNHQYGRPAGIIRMDQGVNQCFTERLMDRSVIPSFVSTEDKWHFQVRSQLLDYFAIEVEKVSRPGTIQG